MGKNEAGNFRNKQNHIWARHNLREMSNEKFKNYNNQQLKEKFDTVG